MRVLIIDDEENIRRVTAAALEGMGHEAALAENGDAALKQLAARVFDAVFLDLKLLDESGIELLPKLLAVTPGLGVIMISGTATAESTAAARHAGAAAFIAKPFTPAEIRQALGNLPGPAAAGRAG
jgi:NtrC-family two-component system response regulator AlgB